MRSLNPVPPPPAAPGSRYDRVVQCIAWLAGWECIAAGFALQPVYRDRTELLWQVAWLALGPVVWMVRFGAAPGAMVAGGLPPENQWGQCSPGADPASTGTRSGRWRAGLLAAGVGALSFGVSALVGHWVGDLPPSIHDEYSYLFQAETFLTGRVSVPCPQVLPELFDQIHVLNDGVRASRYFPGTGLWMAPFVAWGDPAVGQWLAGALAAMCVFAAARELAGDLAGVVSGLVIALSPGAALFHNRLLSHSPTLLGLTLFFWAYFRWQRTQRSRWGVVAGCALSLAMLCRPLTAAAMALPFGIAVVLPALRGGSWREACRRSLARAVPVALPVAIALAGLYGFNRSITGNGWESPYSRYNRVYSPRHAYGFHNVSRAASRPQQRWMRDYDAWARELTWELALEQCETRWEACWRQTLGVLPIAILSVAALLWIPQPPPGTGLLIASAISLHMAYVPYWFVGIDGWHYVFESLAVWGLLAGLASARAISIWIRERRLLAPVWLAGLFAISWGCTYVPAGAREETRFARSLRGMQAARREFARFHRLVEEKAIQRPALVLVEQPPGNIHIDFVVNSPRLDGAVIVGRYDPQSMNLDEIRKAFPERALYVFRERNWSLTPLDEAE
ncbi:MAG: ArnT family glycosyltransferase [Planctomycetales bacterium]